MTFYQDLVEQIESAKRGHRHILAVVGEKQNGKTRLLDSIAKALSENNMVGRIDFSNPYELNRFLKTTLLNHKVFSLPDFREYVLSLRVDIVLIDHLDLLLPRDQKEVIIMLYKLSHQNAVFVIFLSRNPHLENLLPFIAETISI